MSGLEPIGERPSAKAIPAYQVAALSVDLGGRELHQVPPRISTWVVEVVRVEGPVRVSEVARRISEAAGIKRIGSRIQTAIDLAVEYATRQNGVRREGDFLWPMDMRVPVVRDRSELPASLKRLDLVATEEVAMAVERVVVDSFGMEPNAIPPAACRLFGFSRLSEDMRRRIDGVVSTMLAEKRLVVRGEYLLIPDLKVAS